jgi:hypothetical protein
MANAEQRPVLEKTPPEVTPKSCVWRLWSGLVLGLSLAVTASAATFVVTNTADSGPGTLREALQAASTNGPTQVNLAVQGKISLASTLPTIGGNVTITGSGAALLSVSGGQSVPLFSVSGNASVLIEQLTLADGLGAQGGGALRNLGTVVLRQCLVTNNMATNTGGALLNYGTLVLDSCTFVSNKVFGLPGQPLYSTNTAESGFNAEGGAVCSLQGALFMTNCTLWANLAMGGQGGDNGLGSGGSGGAGLGGGLFCDATNSSASWIVNCTIAANQVLGGPGGRSGSIFGPPGSTGWGTGGGMVFVTNTVSLFLENTLLVNNQADHALPDGFSALPLQSLGGNLVGVTNGLFGFVASDLLGADPQLGPLQSNGGPLPTCALPLSSLAVDHGEAAGAPHFDERGVIRPQGNGFDIGAYEVGNQRIIFPPPDANLTYGDAPYLLSATATSELPVTFSVVDGPGLISPTNGSLVVLTGAGTIIVVASQPGSDIYLPAPNVTNSLVVKPAPLSALADDSTRPYGATNPIFSGTLSGVVNGDDITAVFESTATSATPVGTYGPGSPYAITPFLEDPAGRLTNYAVSTSNGTLTITTATQPLVAGVLSTNRPYGGTNPAFQATLTGLLNGDPISVVWVTTATVSSPVGNYPVLPVWSDPEGRLSNYNVVTNAGTLAVTPVPLSVVAADASRPYGESNPVFTGTLSGLVNNDPITAVFRSAATPSTPPGRYDSSTPYAIQPVLIDPAGRLGNYAVTTTSGTLTITKATQPLVVVALSTNRLYGTTNLPWPAVIQGILNGDPISAIWVCAAGPGSSVGNYPMAPVFGDPEGRLADYDVVTNTGTLTVIAAPLTVAAANASRYYGTTNPVFTGPPLSGLRPGDPITATYSCAATLTTPPGVYGPGSPFAIVPSLVDPDNRAGNYKVTLVEGTLTILEAPTVQILEPTNGAIYFTGMDVPAAAQVSGSSSPVQSVSLQFSTNQLAGVTTNGVDFTTTFTNIARGAYTLQAFATNEAGLSFHSDPVSFSVVDISGTAGPVITNSLNVRQTGLYFQDFWITNIASLPVEAVMVRVTGLEPGVQVYNAVGTTNGTNWVFFGYPTPPGQVLRLTVEYYVPDGTPPEASFLVNLGAPTPPFVATGTLVPIGFFGYPWGDGAALLQFQTAQGATYYVQYSADLSSWTTILPAVAGNDSWIEWLDNGPPKTMSQPADDPAGHRFYRVLRAP